MITSFYTGIAILFFIFLSINVILGRRKCKIGLGDGGNDKLRTLIRAHSNFIEYTPLFLIGLFFLETVTYTNKLMLHSLAIIFFLGRIIHFYGMTFAEQYEDGILKSGVTPRVVGMIITFSVLILIATVLVIKFALSY